jgi:hypothetical protein
MNLVLNAVNLLRAGFQTPGAARNLFAKPVVLLHDWMKYFDSNYKTPVRLAIFIDHMKNFKDLVGGTAIIDKGLDWANRWIGWWRKEEIKYPWTCGDHVVSRDANKLEKSELTYNSRLKMRTFNYFAGLGVGVWEGLDYLKNTQLINVSSRMQKQISRFGTLMSLLSSATGTFIEWNFVSDMERAGHTLSPYEISASKARLVMNLAAFALAGLYAPIVAPHRYEFGKKMALTVLMVAQIFALYCKSQMEAKIKAQTIEQKKQP